jgi:hypothetical protein
MALSSLLHTVTATITSGDLVVYDVYEFLYGDST